MVSGNDALVVVHGDLPDDLWSVYAGSGLVAWDIETSGLDWREDQIGTCQLFAEGVGTVVVSVPGVRTPERLATLLQDPGVVKVFHHAPFDLRFMIRWWGVRPASVRCTKVASKLLDPGGPNDTHSLQHLLGRRLGVHLNKGTVRTSNWSAATLSSEQVEYAAADVMHLPALLESLQADLDSRDLAWLYDQCCAFLPAQAALKVGGYPDVFSY
jgi:ribonuclease D